MASVVPLASDLYSTSVLDLDTVTFFVALQLMRFEPRKMTKPPVELWSSISSAQSASENALTRVEQHLSILNPIFRVPLR
jgi:hypothetical protein